MALLELKQENKRNIGAAAIFIVAAYAIEPIRNIISPVADFKILEGTPFITPITAVAIVAIIAGYMAMNRQL